MTIAQDAQAQVAPDYIELFILDLTAIPGLGASIYYLTPSSGTSVIWNSQTFIPWALNIEGIDISADGAPSRPKLNIGNLDANKLIGSLAFQYSDIIGASVTYIRTFSTYLGGAGSISMSPLKYTISKKLGHTRQSISFELRTPIDRERAYLPNRQMLKSDFPGLGVNKYIR